MAGAQGSKDAGPRKRGRILVVENEPELLTALQRILQREHEVARASDGQEALDLLRADPAFDVVLSDLSMPKLDGAALYAAVAAFDPGLAERIVFLHGGAGGPGARKFLESVKNVVLEKPIAAETLRAVVRDVMARST